MPNSKTTLLFYNANEDIEYVCTANPGVQTNQPHWIIKKLLYDIGNKLTAVRFADGTASPTKIADNRELYQYTGLKQTVLIAIEDNAVFDIFDVTASGANYILSGDIGNLGVSKVVFNSAPHITVRREGSVLLKGLEVIWVSPTTFKINSPLLPGQSIIVNS